MAKLKYEFTGEDSFTFQFGSLKGSVDNFGTPNVDVTLKTPDIKGTETFDVQYNNFDLFHRTGSLEFTGDITTKKGDSIDITGSLAFVGQNEVELTYTANGNPYTFEYYLV